MRKLGIDFGAVRVGLAMSDTMGMLATPIDIYVRKHYKKDVEFIANLVKANGVDVVVFGKPFHMNGDIGERIKITEEFAESLKNASGAKIEWIDERLTSVQGARMMQESKSKKQNLDSVCAAIILQTYLDIKK